MDQLEPYVSMLDPIGETILDFVDPSGKTRQWSEGVSAEGLVSAARVYNAAS